MRKTVAFAFTWMFNPQSGGTERVTDIIAKELLRRGYEIHYIYSVKRESDRNFKCPTSNIHYIEEALLLSSAGREQIHKIILDNHIDIVINQGGIMGTCKPFVDLPIGCKSITVIHFDPRYGLNTIFSDVSRLRDNSYIEKIKRIYRFFTIPLRKYRLKKYLTDLYAYWGEKSDRVILLSKKFEPQFINLAKNFPIQKLGAISNPISFPINSDIYNKQNIILWVGRMDYHQKRPDLMVKIWSKIYDRLPDWQLIMLGGGPAFDDIKKSAKHLPRIQFAGVQYSLPFFEKSRINASTSCIEGLPMVLMEAISQGAVPIAFDSYASIHDVIDNDYQLVRPFDIEEYSKKLYEIATNTELQYKLREIGYNTAEQYEISTIVDEWEALFNSIEN